MLSTNSSEFLFVEKYRPKTIAECILPPALKKNFQDIAKSGQIPNVILAGTAGLGKTTVARALCEELGLDYILVNCSEDSGIDVLRTKIRQFASTMSLSGSGSFKVVIMDEADYLNPLSTQPALRGFIEEFSSNCRFIFTCNFKNRIIEPIHSRAPVIEFAATREELVALAGDFMIRLKQILKAENIKHTDKVIAEIIMRYAPDWRRILNECQRHAASGEITPAALVGISDQNLDSLIGFLKNKDFRQMRQWVASNNDVDAASIFRAVYDRLLDAAKPETVPGAVVVLADYAYKSSFVVDRELNTVACMTELMAGTEWK